MNIRCVDRVISDFLDKGYLVAVIPLSTGRKDRRLRSLDRAFIRAKWEEKCSESWNG